jgi:hypothetical protein
VGLQRGDCGWKGTSLREDGEIVRLRLRCSIYSFRRTCSCHLDRTIDPVALLRFNIACRRCRSICRSDPSPTFLSSVRRQIHLMRLLSPSIHRRLPLQRQRQSAPNRSNSATEYRMGDRRSHRQQKSTRVEVNFRTIHPCRCCHQRMSR